jgi:hypothetical protein
MNTSCEKKQQHIIKIFYMWMFCNPTGKLWLTEPERMYVNKHCVFYCGKSKTIHGGTPVQTIMYISITKGLCTLITHIDYFLELAFAKSPSTECSWFCIELVIRFLYLLCSWIIAIFKECRCSSLFLFSFYYFFSQNFLLSFNILFENKN